MSGKLPSLVARNKVIRSVPRDLHASVLQIFLLLATLPQYQTSIHVLDSEALKRLAAESVCQE